MASADEAVRNYLLAVKDPGSVRDEDAIAQLRTELDGERDPLQRLKLQQRLLDEETVGPAKFEDAFVKAARSWSESKGVTHAAFQAEGVEDPVLRRAGFTIPRGGTTQRRRPSGTGRRRVNAGDIRKAIPRGTFTVKDVQEASGASAAVVRRVIQEEVDAGRVTDKGAAPDHKGPGRAPTLYSKP